ncbi:MAG: DEDDh family exonuclease [Mycolicibacterium sp.]|nr:DEDDh family exonuclease [Mycolicibacterium sp.]
MGRVTCDTSALVSGFVGVACDSEAVSAPTAAVSRATPWGRPIAEHDAGWVVLDVETTGFRPGQARIISLAALALDPDGAVARSVVSLLNPGVDPGPTHVHGLTAEMLADQPRFADIAPGLVGMLEGRTLVAHNVAFDYAFLAAEAELADIELPVDIVMCTVELTRRLGLGTDNLRLETLAAHWGIPQLKPHDAFDDALVLSRVLAPALVRARQLHVWLPLRPATRRRWPNGRVTHDELRPLKMVAARVPCPWLNPGRHVPGRPLVQGMRVALSADVQRTHEELVERIMHAGLAYCDMIDPETSLVICNDPNIEHGKGFQAREIGVPIISDADFMAGLDSVIGGTSIEEFTDDTIAGRQFALF